MSEAALVPPAKNYSAFDADLTHKALNVRLFVRLLGWMKPYRFTLISSMALVVVAAASSVMMPVITGRVIIDMVLLPNPQSADLPDYGLIAATRFLAELFSVEMLTAAVFLYVGLVIVQTLLRYAHQLTLASAALKGLRDLRVDLFTALERKPASFFDHVAVGRLMTRVTNDVGALFDLLSGFGMLAGEFVPFFLAVFLMLHLSSQLTGMLMFVVPVAAVGTYIFRVAMRQIFRLVRNSVSALNQYMQEDLMGIEIVQLSGREAMNSQAYGELNSENRRQQFRAVDYEVVFETFNTSLGSIATALIVWYGGGQVVQNEISLGSMVLFTQLIGMMVTPVIAVGQQFNSLFRSMASGERIFQALDWKETLHEPAHPVVLPERLEGDVELRNVSFSYAVGGPVLKDVSFKIAPGEKLAIVGPTGSGKSTVIRLLVRFYDIEDKTIFIDGIDVNDILSRDLRKRVGVVLQDFHVFSGSVLDNITLNNPAISRERAEWAAEVVHADRFIRELPEGYDSILAERGQNLSQGQRQLLAFARVLAADPEILVLDEATANIDTATELIIQDALHRLTEGRTSIIIAHRLQTIQECDRVLVLHHGVVEELGTHDELIAHGGIYHTLHELQFQDDEVTASLKGEAVEDGEGQPPKPPKASPSAEDDPWVPGVEPIA